MPLPYQPPVDFWALHETARGHCFGCVPGAHYAINSVLISSHAKEPIVPILTALDAFPAVVRVLSAAVAVVPVVVVVVLLVREFMVRRADRDRREAF
jgi:hypothetical protein